MPYTIRVGSVEITCDSFAEAKDLALALSNASPAGSATAGPPAPPADAGLRDTLSLGAGSDGTVEGRAHRLLKLMMEDADGIPIATVMAIYNVQQPRGLGSAIKSTKAMLTGLGIDPTRVITIWRSRPRGLLWKAGPSCGEALRRLEARLANRKNGV